MPALSGALTTCASFTERGRARSGEPVHSLLERHPDVLDYGSGPGAFGLGRHAGSAQASGRIDIVRIWKRFDANESREGTEENVSGTFLLD